MNEDNERKRKVFEELIEALKEFDRLNSREAKEVQTDKMKKQMRNILDMLSAEKGYCDKQRLLESLKQYLDNYGRVLYSEVTVYLYKLSDENSKKLEIVISNIDSLLEECVDDDPKVENRETKVILKLWDHINLANNQLNTLKMSDETIHNKIALQANPISDDLKKTKEDLDASKKELYTQLISIVSIFVAIAFVLFGGMSLMNNLFNYENIDKIPLFEMLCAGSLIGIVMIMSIYAFIVFVLRITGKYDYSKEQQDNIKNLTDLVNRIYEDSNKSLLGKIFALITYGKSKVKAPYRNVVAVVLFVLLSIMVVCGSIVYFS